MDLSECDPPELIVGPKMPAERLSEAGAEASGGARHSRQSRCIDVGREAAICPPPGFEAAQERVENAYCAKARRRG